ncbi:hypothetical protein ACFZDJ_47695 [Streptomyces sp. NPDC007896]|uniref:hypothetical protein n=1 Tax=Streptomyces sp. NPDC007896 TaxID=3364784 RepID=UPI0036E4A127
MPIIVPPPAEAMAPANSPEVDVIVLGGRPRYPNEALVGSTAEQQLRSIPSDVVFPDADGLVAGRGLCVPTLEQAKLKHRDAVRGTNRGGAGRPL